MEPSDRQVDGLALKTYVETRFNLLIESFQASEAASDLRYQQRFEAQAAALSAAFDAAKEAVQAALASQDRAVTKTEISAEKRFEALTALITQRFDGVADKIEATNRRVETLENRFNTFAAQHVGALEGGKAVKDENRANLAAIGTVIAILSALAGWLVGR